jgi:hypothetical protein
VPVVAGWAWLIERSGDGRVWRPVLEGGSGCGCPEPGGSLPHLPQWGAGPELEVRAAEVLTRLLRGAAGRADGAGVAGWWRIRVWPATEPPGPGEHRAGYRRLPGPVGASPCWWERSAPVLVQVRTPHQAHAIAADVASRA